MSQKPCGFASFRRCQLAGEGCEGWAVAGVLVLGMCGGWGLSVRA